MGRSSRAGRLIIYLYAGRSVLCFIMREITPPPYNVMVEERDRSQRYVSLEERQRETECDVERPTHSHIRETYIRRKRLIFNDDMVWGGGYVWFVEYLTGVRVRLGA